MAVNFVQQKKKQKYLLYIVGIVIIITIIVLWFGYFREPETVLPAEGPDTGAAVRKITINLEVLKNPLLERLELFEDIPDFEGQKGRVNPFLPY